MSVCPPPFFENVRRRMMLTLLLLTLVALPIVVDFALRGGHTTGELTLVRQPVLVANSSHTR